VAVIWTRPWHHLDRAGAIELQDALEVREQHLDLLSLAARGDVGVGGGDFAGEIASPCVDRKGDFAGGHVGRAAFPQGAAAAILLSRGIADEAVLAYVAPAVAKLWFLGRSRLPPGQT